MRDRKAAPPRTLRQQAIAWLARREHSRAELATRLAMIGAPGGEVDTLLDELERAGYLSDARFAAMVVRQKRRGHGRRAIASALRDKGVAAGAAKDALAALDGADELAEARTLWQRRFGKAPADAREKARQVRFLVGRGYALGIALRVLDEAGTPVAGEVEP